MSEAFVISDTHFGHRNLLKLVPLRGKLWDTAEAMDAAMIDNWNRTVGPKDTVYHLGDLTLGKERHIKVMDRMNGRKVLLPGNHDTAPMDVYGRYFDDVLPSVWPWTRAIVFSHAPLHPSCLSLRGHGWRLNVHGHIHARVVERGGTMDPRYFNASVEQIDFTPYPLEKVKARLEKIDLTEVMLDKEWEG